MVMVLTRRSWVDETGGASPADVASSWYGLSPTLRLTLDLAPGGYSGLLPVSASLRILIFLPDPRVTCLLFRGFDWKGNVVEIVYERVAAIDVGKREVAVTVRTPGQRRGPRTQQTRKFRTYFQVLRQMVDWLVAQGVTHVAMEATGDYVRHEGA